MKYNFFFLVLILFMSTKCSEDKISKRTKLINELIVSIQKMDTLGLYNLVDTAYSNDIYGRDNFLATMNFLNNNFSECGAIDLDSANVNTAGETTEYTYALCTKPNKLASKLVVGFDDYKKEEKILFCIVRTTISEQDSNTLRKLLPRPDSTLLPKQH